MAKHTPKPWSVGGKEGSEATHPMLTIESDFGQVATVTAENCDDDDQVLADAVLMAAAPDLLEALQELLSRVDLVLYRRYVGGDLIDKCRAAIRKAVI